MKKATWIVLLSFFCLSAGGQTFDVSSWDTSSIRGYDMPNGKVYTFMADPASENTGILVQKMMQGFILVTEEILVKTKWGNCHVGDRSVLERKSYMRWRKFPCDQFNTLHAVWQKQALVIIQESMSQPLEKN